MYKINITKPCLWLDARSLCLPLIEDGWMSPDSYSNHFAEPPDGPSVYLFMPYKKMEMREAFIAYVGMSTNLKQRFAGHEVLAEIAALGVWAKRWFKPVPEKQLHDLERELIVRFDPPWNIIGRRRGVPLS